MNGLLSSDDRKSFKNLSIDDFKDLDVRINADGTIRNDTPSSIPEKLRENQVVSVPSLKLGKPSNSGVSQGSLSISEEYKLEKEKQVKEESVETNITETEVEENKLKDSNEMEKPDDGYAELCKQCVIRDLLGCDRCGIFVYGYRHKQFKIVATKLQ